MQWKPIQTLIMDVRLTSADRVSTALCWDSLKWFWNVAHFTKPPCCSCSKQYHYAKCMLIRSFAETEKSSGEGCRWIQYVSGSWYLGLSAHNLTVLSHTHTYMHTHTYNTQAKETQMYVQHKWGWNVTCEVAHAYTQTHTHMHSQKRKPCVSNDICIDRKSTRLNSSHL